MKRSLFVATALTLAGCHHSKPPAAAPPPASVAMAASGVAPAVTATPSAVATTPAPQPSSSEVAARVQAILPHWIELLERGDDTGFIDEAVVPEELEKVLGGKSKVELVTTFRQDKRAGVLKMLSAIRGAQPTKIREESTRTLVTYEFKGEKGVTFVVVGANVYIKN
jgi:hypothetical protein